MLLDGKSWVLFPTGLGAQCKRGHNLILISTRKRQLTHIGGHDCESRLLRGVKAFTRETNLWRSYSYICVPIQIYFGYLSVVISDARKMLIYCILKMMDIPGGQLLCKLTNWKIWRICGCCRRMFVSLVISPLISPFFKSSFSL